MDQALNGKLHHNKLDTHPITASGKKKQNVTQASLQLMIIKTKSGAGYSWNLLVPWLLCQKETHEHHAVLENKFHFIMVKQFAIG